MTAKNTRKSLPGNVFGRQMNITGQESILQISCIREIYAISHLPWGLALSRAQGSLHRVGSRAFCQTQFAFRRSVSVLDRPRKTSQQHECIGFRALDQPIRQLASPLTHNKTLANRDPRNDNCDTVNPRMIKTGTLKQSKNIQLVIFVSPQRKVVHDFSSGRSC